MKAQELITELTRLIATYGDCDLAVDVPSKNQVFELTETVDTDVFEPGGPMYFVLETDKEV